MKRSLFSVALACLAVAAAVPASAQINTNGIQEGKGPFGPFNLAEAYPCAFGGYSAPDNGITPEQLFHGTCASAAIASAAPGILSLQRQAGTLNLDVNCFAVAPEGQFNCVVQAYRLFKMVPGSFKCPDVYGLPHFHLNSDGNYVLDPYTYVQFGGGVRTWWALNFTQPGTRFLLQVISTCEVPQQTETVLVNGVPTVIPVPGSVQHTQLHVDSWRWRVVANEHTLLNVINLMHTGAISTLEVPCILGEDMYDALVNRTSSARRTSNCRGTWPRR